MNALSRLRSRPGLLLIILAGLVGGHTIIFYLLRQTRMSLVGISGVVMVLLFVVKHLGLLSALTRPLHGLVRKRYKRSDD